MKEELLFFCTCTALEVMTAVGVTGYLLYIGEFTLSLISMIVFGKLIIFHFVMDYFDKKNNIKTLPVSKKSFL
ncbi:MAG: hypothetical protein ACR2LL_14000 [Nitrosopumilus sp.]